MVRQLGALGRRVDCPGKVCNNMRSVEAQTGLKNKNHSKQTFLRRYVFNLCPENSDGPGYMTEKVMQACMSDCIPIYYGVRNLHAGILNPKRMLFCQSLNALGSTTVERLRQLFQKDKDDAALKAFFMQPVFLQSAPDRIRAFRQGFRGMITNLCTRLGLLER